MMLPAIQTPEGHKLAMDEMGNLLVKTAKTKTTADYVYVAESSMVMPCLLLDLTIKSGLVFSTLWKRMVLAKKKAAKPAKKKAQRKSVKKITKKVVKKKR